MSMRKIVKRISINIKDTKRMAKYKKLKPASTGEDMRMAADMIKKLTTLRPQNVFEIGANLAQDAEVLMQEFAERGGVRPDSVYVFEAHPQLFRYIKRLHRFNAYHCAVSNEDGNHMFHMPDALASNSGVSSLLENHEFNYTQKVKVKTIRMDTFMKDHSITAADFVKIDVEGCTWEVLDGFGDRLRDVRAIQLEAEHTEAWKGEKLYYDIEKKMTESGFELLWFERKFDQSDSLWVKKEFVKIQP